MINKEITKYEVLAEAGAIFAAEITTSYIELGNYQNVDFIIATGIGTAANVTVKVLGKLGSSGTAAAIKFKKKTGPISFDEVSSDGATFSIGGAEGKCGFVVYRVDSDSFKGKLDRIALNVSAVANSTVPGAIVALVSKPRLI